MLSSKMLKFIIWLISHLHLGTFHMLQSKFHVASYRRIKWNREFANTFQSSIKTFDMFFSLCILVFKQIFAFLFSFRCAVRRDRNAVKKYFFKESFEYLIKKLQPKNRTGCYRATVILSLADV